MVALDTTVVELDRLVEETYLLWDEEWVGFSWRNYTHEHMRRVRALSGTLAAMTGADPAIVSLAATLHDVTKSYDGEILVDADGKRVLDENGFWRNATLLPRRSNDVTVLYERLGLAGTVHHTSGGAVARVLLSERGFEQHVVDAVEQAIVEHLIASDASSIAGKCLYDADTIDANIGMAAFYRNIQISLHHQDGQYAARGEDFPRWLADNFGEFLTGYLRERIPTWIEGKARDFVPKLMTSAGRDVATARLDSLRDVVAMMITELDDTDRARQSGALAVIETFMTRRQNPKLVEVLAHVAPRADGSRAGHALLGHFRAEISGHA